MRVVALFLTRTRTPAACCGADSRFRAQQFGCHREAGRPAVLSASFEALLTICGSDRCTGRRAAATSSDRLRPTAHCCRDKTTMKLLENPRLSALTAFLSQRRLGERVLDGRVEAFSCKRAGEDKKLAKELEAQFAAESRNSPSSMEAASR